MTDKQLDLGAIGDLVKEKLVYRRPHPQLPLCIYNYTRRAQSLSPIEWSPMLRACRGLIIDDNGEVIGRPFDKFWNYEQMLDSIPAAEEFTVWEKLDGSLGIVCNYKAHRIVATRGSFESEQALWASKWLEGQSSAFLPDAGATFLFEIIYPENRIVVDYGNRAEMILLAVLRDGADDDNEFARSSFAKARRFDGTADFSTVNTLAELSGQEGLVVRWRSGFRAKIKLEEYKRLHRLVTQCSSRTIWEMLRVGKSTDELFDSVPQEFKAWALEQIEDLTRKHSALCAAVREEKNSIHCESRKEFAEIARTKQYPGLLFLLLDGRDISSPAWKFLEPEFACPFRSDDEG